MTHIQEELKRIVFSGPLRGVKLFQVNDSFFEFSKEGYWIIDGGIELDFPGGVVSAVWDSNNELFTLSRDLVRNVYRQDNLIQLENENIIKLNRYNGLQVVDAEFKSLEFDYVADYTMRVEKEERLVELVLYFEDKVHIQIAFIDYTLEENKAPTDFSFDLNNDILVSTRHVFEIKPSR